MSFVCVPTVSMRGISQNHLIPSSTSPCRPSTNKASKPIRTKTSRPIHLPTPTINSPDPLTPNKSSKNNPHFIPNKTSVYRPSTIRKCKKTPYQKKLSPSSTKTTSSSKGPSPNSPLTPKNSPESKAQIPTYLFYNQGKTRR